MTHTCTLASLFHSSFSECQEGFLPRFWRKWLGRHVLPSKRTRDWETPSVSMWTSYSLKSLNYFSLKLDEDDDSAASICSPYSLWCWFMINDTNLQCRNVGLSAAFGMSHVCMMFCIDFNFNKSEENTKRSEPRWKLSQLYVQPICSLHVLKVWPFFCPYNLKRYKFHLKQRWIHNKKWF